MLRTLILISVLLSCAGVVSTQPSARPTPTPSATTPFQLTDYGVQIQPDERLVSYMRAYQAEGDRLRPQSAEMVRAVLSYLHTRPIAVATERVRVKSPDKKKADAIVYSTRQHDRHFYIVPDLLAAPGTINFRVIADDYYAIVPEGSDPTSPEIRHAFLQFVIDPLVRKFNKEISAQRDQVKQLIDLRTKDGATVSPDVFIVVGRSLVAAAEARFDEAARL